MDTLLLNPTTWDLMLDSNNNIALASNPYAIAQDVASAIRTFQGEVYYDTTLGLPYLTQILGQDRDTALAIFISLAETEALRVPEVVQAQGTEIYYDNRAVSGVIEVIDTTGAANNISF